jgi:hypothetical protein
MILAESVQYLAFDEVKDGYIFFAVLPRYKNCAKLKVIKGSKEIGKEHIADFLKNGVKVTYDISKIPNNKDFRFDVSFHFPSDVGKKNYANITITGERDGERKPIRHNKIELNPSFRNFDFSYIVPKINKD